MEKYAEAVGSIRGEAYNDGNGLPNARVAYIEFGSAENIQVVISLNDDNNKKKRAEWGGGKTTSFKKTVVEKKLELWN